ncbi:MAG: peptide ABC transporter substrate-binding protein [Betaproteobacteria bacterium]|nr:peptide ABC transporter substrate-binding protein [Betaproteobacteria bacterium]
MELPILYHWPTFRYTRTTMNIRSVCLALTALLGACEGPWNNPYPAVESGQNIFYSTFSERPKHLDPVQSYSENEYLFIAQIYTPPLQYHYLKRPYELIPFAAESVPQPRYFDINDRELPKDASARDIAYSLYEIKIKPGMHYQPHPAFALDPSGRPKYLALSEAALADVHELRDFKDMGSREVVAEDFVYQIKRLAHPRLHSPIFGLMSEYIAGLNEYAQILKKDAKGLATHEYLDLKRHALSGAYATDRYTYKIRVKGKYPQFVYWLAMPFFAPVPEEADRFYSQAGMAERNLNFDWYPVGSGPYMLSVNNPNRQMVMERNPNYFVEAYPSEGEPEDITSGMLADAGKPMPFIGKVIYSLEKEAIPGWNKFLQGYYDSSGISSDNFDRVIEISGMGDAQLTEEMQMQGIELRTAVAPSISYYGFNMLDPVVGGDAGSARKLRQAISIAFDIEEYIAIFMNGRGVAGQGPIAPGIIGYLEGQAGMNPIVYQWRNNEPQRRSLNEAKQLLTEAGYRNGIDARSGKPLTLHFDTTLVGAQGKPMVDWLVKQFKKIDIELVVRNTDYNRFQEKMRKGIAQIYRWGWNADYPDPENFLFLLYGPQGKVKASGQNASNYANPEYDRLFEQMRELENGTERKAVVDKMLAIARRDSPWIWGLHPKEYGLAHKWIANRKPNKMANNSLKYLRVDARQRDVMRERWNRPVLWPAMLLACVLAAVAIPGAALYRRRERAAALGAV